MIVINAIQSVLSIVLMIAIGYILSHKGWFDEKTSKLFSRLMIEISIPALMISNLTSSFDREKLVSAGMGLVIPFAAIIASYIISMIVAKIIKVRPERKGAFQSLFTFSNTIFVGLPVAVSLFGQESSAFVMLYYFANTTLFWIIGVYGIRQDSAEKKEPLFTVTTLKKIFSPPLLGFLAAVVIIMFRIELPMFIMNAAKYMGNLSTPMSMIYIGMIIYSIGFKGIKVDKDMIALLAGRFIITPFLVFIMLRLIPAPDLMRKVFIIVSSMPVMTQNSIVIQAYKGDHRYAAVMVTVTTAASLVFIPFYMYLLG